jgi:hypothetical protein
MQVPWASSRQSVTRSAHDLFDRDEWEDGGLSGDAFSRAFARFLVLRRLSAARPGLLFVTKFGSGQPRVAAYDCRGQPTANVLHNVLFAYHNIATTLPMPVRGDGNTNNKIFPRTSLLRRRSLRLVSDKVVERASLIPQGAHLLSAVRKCLNPTFRQQTIVRNLSAAQKSRIERELSTSAEMVGYWLVLPDKDRESVQCLRHSFRDCGLLVSPPYAGRTRLKIRQKRPITRGA